MSNYKTIKIGGKAFRRNRFVAAKELKRPILASEHVDHINGDKGDDDPMNLQVLPVQVHMSIHKQVYPDIKSCVVCGTAFEVNPRKRKRNKCCSPKCAQQLRVAGRKQQVQEFWKNDVADRYPSGDKRPPKSTPAPSGK